MGGETPESARTKFWDRGGLIVLGGGLGAGLCFAPLRSSETPVFLLWPFLATILVFGLPHGAVDHVVLRRHVLLPTNAQGWPQILGAYIGLMLLYLVFWAIAPVMAFAAFIVLTAFHWGQGDLWWSRWASRARFSRWQGGVFLACRGALPMALPFVAAPGVYLEVAAATVDVFGERLELPEAASPAIAWSRGVVGLVVAILLIVAHFRQAWRLAFESLLLGAFFLLLHPLVSIGLYFAFWHAPRHIVRILVSGGKNGAPPQSWPQFYGVALPTTLAALAILAAIFLLAPAGGWWGLLGSYLVLLAVVTLPHAVVVTLMDRKNVP